MAQSINIEELLQQETERHNLQVKNQLLVNSQEQVVSSQYLSVIYYTKDL